MRSPRGRRRASDSAPMFVAQADEAAFDPADGFPAAATLTSQGGRCSIPLLPGVPASASATARGLGLLGSVGCSCFCCFKCQCADKYEDFQVRSRCSLAAPLGQRPLSVHRIILMQCEHRIVGRCSKTAGFYGSSKTPFHSETPSLVLSKTVFILPCLPSPSRAPFLPA